MGEVAAFVQQEAKQGRAEKRSAFRQPAHVTDGKIRRKALRFSALRRLLSDKRAQVDSLPTERR